MSEVTLYRNLQRLSLRTLWLLWACGTTLQLVKSVALKTGSDILYISGLWQLYVLVALAVSAKDIGWLANISNGIFRPKFGWW